MRSKLRLSQSACSSHSLDSLAKRELTLEQLLIESFEKIVLAQWVNALEALIHVAPSWPALQSVRLQSEALQAALLAR